MEIVLQPFRREWLDLPDDQLGARLLAEWARRQAALRGIPPREITAEILQNIRDATIGVDTDNAELPLLEKALRRVAAGDAAGGGKLFREHMLGDARSRVDRKFAAEAIKRRKQVKSWSRSGVDARREYSDEDKARWREMASLMSGKSTDKASSVRAREIRRKQENGDNSPTASVRTIRREIGKR